VAVAIASVIASHNSAMINFWAGILFYVTGIALAALLAGALFGELTGWLMATGLLLYWVIYQLYNLQLMMGWLKDFRLERVPTGSGAWDHLFSSVYKLAKSFEQQRQQLAETLKGFRNATEAMPDGVVTLDEDNQVIYANEQAEEHLGISSQRDAGRNLINIVRHPDFVAYLNSQSWDKSVVLRGPRDPGRMLQVQLIPYGNRQRLLMTRDITQIERLETTRRDFVANVSHELKTPLTVLSGFLETIREMPVTDEQRQQYLGLMHAQARRMENIVEDLLVLSKLESTTNPAPEALINMADALTQLTDDANTLSRHQHQIESVNDNPAGLLGAEDELMSAFSNLVSNAIRYTPQGGKIVLSWTTNPQGGGIFSVTDTGPGIESTHLPRLTERFYRVDRSRSRDTGGTGLGLAIVKHVATRHQAQLVIDSEVGKGSCFSLVFPEKRLR
jgi:two-component system, OmpR family, phosphate regulon sensor histidine kinase PhoR